MAHRAILDDRAVLALSGADARDFLQGLVTNDMARLDAQEALYAGLLTPQGKILFEFLVVRRAEEGYFIDCAEERSAELLKRLGLYKLRSKVMLSKTELRVAAVWGEGGALPLPAGAQSFDDPRHPALGTRIIADRHPLAEASLDRADAYHAHRIALGVPDSADLPPDTVFALDAGFEELHGVDFKKGCYVGQEVTSRMKHRASARKRFFIAESGGILPQGSPVVADGREIGIVASGVGGRSLALVRLDRYAEAHDAGTTIAADGVPVVLRAPGWFKMPSGG